MLASSIGRCFCDSVGASGSHYAFALRGNVIVKTRSRDELQRTFLATGCANNEASVIDKWKIRDDSLVLSEMFAYCSLTAKGKGQEEQRLQCCGPHAMAETCRPSCSRQHVFSAERSDIELQKVFLQTGCTNDKPPVIAHWKTLPDAAILSDMFAYCNVNAEGKASEIQRSQCCGPQATAETCKPSCSRVHSFLGR